MLFFSLTSHPRPGEEIELRDYKIFGNEASATTFDPTLLHQSHIGTSKSQSGIKLDFHSQKITIGDEVITRTTPLLNDIMVEGADGLFEENTNQKYFHFTDFVWPKAKFKLNPAEALEIAIQNHPNPQIHDPYVEKTAGTYEEIWLNHYGEIRPAYKTRLPALSIFDLQDIYVDASTGDILKIENSAQFHQVVADAFQFSPLANQPLAKSLTRVSLPDLVGVTENGPLRSQYLDVRNCCQYYVCPNEKDCPDEQKVCGYPSHEGARQTRATIEVPTATLGLDTLVSLPDKIFVDTVRCTNIPMSRASPLKDDASKIGFFDPPIDDNSPDADRDRFSEVQAYFSIISFFNYMRFLMGDNTWCLRKEAMECDEHGQAVMNEDGRPTKPFKVFVNQLIPDTKMDENQGDADSFIQQISRGLGSKENPIKLDRLMRTGNAAFVPALSSLKKTTPRADEILSDLIKNFDHLSFFQGDRDFAYDGDVIFHEFTHATITTLLVQKLNTLGLDPFGISAEPGSLNEGWADYFAAAFTNDPVVGEYAAVKDGFGETSLRNIDNQNKCPNDIVGEIHNDSQVWSGALWEIRQEVSNKYGRDMAFDFDRAVLASLATAKTTENFKDQSATLLQKIQNSPKLPADIFSFAEKVLEERGVSDCFRAFNLSRADEKNQVISKTKDMLFVPSKKNIGLLNYAPSNSQLEIGIPAGARSVTLKFRQFLGGTGALLGNEIGSKDRDTTKPLGVLKSFDLPINWQFNKTSIPLKNSTEIDFDITDPMNLAQFRQDHWEFTVPLNNDRCEQPTLYISLLSQDFQYILKDINVSFTMGDEDLSDCNFHGSQRGQLTVAERKGQGCSNSLGTWWGLLSLLGILLQWRRKRVLKKKRPMKKHR